MSDNTKKGSGEVMSGWKNNGKKRGVSEVMSGQRIRDIVNIGWGGSRRGLRGETIQRLKVETLNRRE